MIELLVWTTIAVFGATIVYRTWKWLWKEANAIDGLLDTEDPCELNDPRDYH